jgi:EAL domain-containing protein (putative c-di-GMP-specific phosphodiesterase class I)
MRYQPIVHLETGVAIGAEAFSRFPTGSPLDWFRAAEETGLGRELETRVVQNILDKRSRWPKRWEMVCVNISPERLADPAMCELLASTLGEQLVVELTDQTALPSDVVLRRRLEELRNRGVRIAVSGLRPTEGGQDRILRIEPEVVKLDVDAMLDIGAGTSAHRNVAALVATCHRAGIFVVAVGVETAAQRDVAQALGVEAVQGHLYGVPMDLDDAIESCAHLVSPLEQVP